MKITPLEIKQQQFEKSLRGFDVADVQQFLILVSNEYENLLNKNKDLEEQIEKLSERVKHYEKVEEALHETLQTTKESVAQKMDNARADAKHTMEKAHLDAESIVKEANHQKAQIRQNILRLLDRREEIIVGISSYLETASNTIKTFKDDEMKIFSLENEANDLPIETKYPPIKENKTGKRFKFDDNSDTNNEFIQQSHDNGYAPGSDRLDDILDEID